MDGTMYAFMGMLLCSSGFLFLILHGLQAAGEFLPLDQGFYGD